MLRSVVIIWIIFLAIFGIYSLFSWEKNNEPMSYEEYIEEVLQRNTPDEKKYTVMIDVHDIYLASWTSGETSQNKNQATNTNNAETNDQSSPMIFSWERSWDIARWWNFWTPEITRSWDITLNSNCAGLVFDPCIVPPEFPKYRPWAQLDLMASTPFLR